MPFLVSAPQKFIGSSISIFGLLSGASGRFPEVDEKLRCSGCPLNAELGGGKVAETLAVGVLAIGAG